MILISSLGYLSSVLISRFQIHFNGCPFFRVHITWVDSPWPWQNEKEARN